MSFDALEQSGDGALPYELYQFQGTGIEFFLTSADTEITYLGNVYTPTTVSRTEVEQSNEVVSGQMKIYIPKNHPLADLMLPYLPASQIAVTIFGSHYSDTETVVLFTGTIATSRYTDQCELTCNSEQYLLQHKIPAQLYQSPCCHVFGDLGCTVPLADHTYGGTITAIDSTGTVLTVPGFSSIPDSLTGGYLIQGNATRMIVAHSGSSITLLSPIDGLATGQGVSGVAGCALTFSACEGYANIRNFLGFDLMPEVNPFDGSAAVG